MKKRSIYLTTFIITIAVALLSFSFPVYADAAPINEWFYLWSLFFETLVITLATEMFIAFFWLFQT